ncbi:unnamed protein product [Parnassius mnemosyne]
MLDVQAIVHNEQGVKCHTRLTQDRAPLQEVTVTNEAQNKVFDENEIVEFDQYNDNIDRSLPLLSRQHLLQNRDKELAEEEINYSTNWSTPSLSDNELFVTKEQEMINETPSLEGNRLVDIGYIFSQLATMSHHPFDCNFTSMDFIKEKRVGFMSSFHFVCKMCKIEKIILSQDPIQKDYINASIVEGVFQTGNGYAQLDEICASVNMPNMSERYYIKISSKLGDIHRDVALQHMLEAGKEEKQLAIEQGDIDTDGIPYITVITDGSWGKRSYGTNFNSLSGVGCIIGFNTKKILFIGVRNSYCCICAVAAKRKTEVLAHKCYKNWFGSSTEMETDAIVEGFKISVSMHGLKYSKLIGDGDSSVGNALRNTMPYGPNIYIRKIECSNHLMRNYSNKLRKIVKNTENKNGPVPVTLRKALSDRMRRLHKAVTGAIEHSAKLNLPLEGKIRSLKEDLLNGPCHVFGLHNSCKNYFCKNENIVEMNLVPQLKACGIWADIYENLGWLTQNAESLLLKETNNPAEHFNSIIAKFLAGKRVNFSLRGTYEKRCYAAVSEYNTKDYKLMQEIQKNIMCDDNIKNSYTQKYVAKKQKIIKNKRKRRIEDALRGIKRAKRSKPADHHYGNVTSEPDLPMDVFITKKAEFLESLQKTHSEILSLERDTVDQSNSDIWIVERRKRITASIIGQICKMKPTTPCTSIIKIMLYSTFTGNDSTRYGKSNEITALKEFANELNISITPCGLFVDDDYCFLGASPDGLIGDDGIVEIKCPSSASALTPLEAIKSKKVVFCTEDGDGIKLKRNHNYYYQVQAQLKIAKKSFCYFVLWTPKGFLYEKIYKDPTFWSDDKILKMTQFYFKCVLPEIIDPRFPRKLPMRDRFNDCY